MSEKWNEWYLEIVKLVGTDEDAVELYAELLHKAIEYTAVRAEWTCLSIEEKMDQDQGRTMKHDSVIVKFNQLAKYMELRGQKPVWRKELGENRKDIGDFANYIVFRNALRNR